MPYPRRTAKPRYWKTCPTPASLANWLSHWSRSFRRRASPATIRHWSPPNHASLLGRFRNRKYHPRVLHADVVARQPTGESLLGFVIARQVRADHFPRMPLVRRHVHELTAGVNLVMIVR